MNANERRNRRQWPVIRRTRRKQPCTAAVLVTFVALAALMPHHSVALLVPTLRPGAIVRHRHRLTHQRLSDALYRRPVTMTATTTTDSSSSFADRVLHAATAPVRQARRLHSFFATQLPMLGYLWPRDDPRLRAFLALSMVFMVLGKWVNVKVPFILQRAIDTVSQAAGAGAGTAVGGSVVASGVFKGLPTSFVPAAAAIAFYGVSRALSVVFSEAKTCLFTHVSQNVLRRFASSIFAHLHSLDRCVRGPAGLRRPQRARALPSLSHSGATLLQRVPFRNSVGRDLRRLRARHTRLPGNGDPACLDRPPRAHIQAQLSTPPPRPPFWRRHRGRLRGG